MKFFNKLGLSFVALALSMQVIIVLGQPVISADLIDVRLLSLDFGNASLITLPNTAEFAGYDYSPVERFRYAAQDAWAQGPFATAKDYYKVQKLREERGPIAGTSVADLKKKYAKYKHGKYRLD